MVSGPISDKERAIIIEMKANRKSSSDIAKKLNCKVDRIKNYCRSNNIVGASSADIDYGYAICKGCGQKFKKRTHSNQYCTPACWPDRKNSPKPREERFCLYCGKSMGECYPQKVYCDQSCSAKYRRRMSSGRKYCIECGGLLPFGKQKYCNSRCRSIYYEKNPRYTGVCESCGRQYKTNKASQVYCSNSCQRSQLGGTESEREKRFAKQFESFHPGFRYHSDYNGSEGTFKMQCKKCGHIQERASQIARPKNKNVTIKCGNCLVIAKEREAELERLIRRVDQGSRRYDAWVKEETEKLLREAKLCSHVCDECGERFKANSMGAKYCSSGCMNKHNDRVKKLRKRMRAYANGTVDKGIGLGKLIKKDKGVCHICGEKVDARDYVTHDSGAFVAGPKYPSIDHVIPISKGGTHTWDNVRLAHFQCNSEKSDNLFYAGEGKQLTLAI